MSNFNNYFCQDEKLKEIKVKIIPLLSGLTYEEIMDLMCGIKCDIENFPIQTK